jgi:hypothetical protein
MKKEPEQEPDVPLETAPERPTAAQWIESDA